MFTQTLLYNRHQKGWAKFPKHICIQSLTKFRIKQRKVMPCTYAYYDVFFSIHSETKRWTKHFLVMQYFYWLNNFILWLHLVACHWQQLTIFIHLSYIRNCFIARKTIWQFPAGLAATTAQFVSSDFSLINNPLCAKCFIGNIQMYSQFISLLHTDMTQVVKILLYGRQKFTYST